MMVPDYFQLIIIYWMHASYGKLCMQIKIEISIIFAIPNKWGNKNVFLTATLKTESGEETQGTPLPSVIEEEGDGESAEGVSTGFGGATTVGEAPSSTSGDTPSLHDLLAAPPSPTLSMVTKHSNGTLNLWQLTFADKTKFTQVR